MLSIMNAALISVGEQEIVSENDGSDEYRLMSRNWPMVVEAELEDGNYRFSKEYATLETRSDGKFGFNDAYLVPADALHVRNLFVTVNGERCETDWVQDATHVHINNTEGCTIEYLSTPEPDLWSANFCKGVQKKMEAICLRAIREEYRDAEVAEAEAERCFAKARAKSSQSRSTVTPFKRGRIASARFQRGFR